MDWMVSADFWIGLLKIVWINIILSGDNAVVIALAACCCCGSAFNSWSKKRAMTTKHSAPVA